MISAAQDSLRFLRVGSVVTRRLGDACEERCLVGVIPSALAAGLALIPLALGGDKPGNEIQTPMAIVILFGLLTSMVLNMVIVPALYLRLGQPFTTGQDSPVTT